MLQIQFYTQSMQHQQLWQLAMRPFVKVIIPINYYQRYQIQILITWTSTGSGSFDNVNVEDPIYTLSPGDKTSGSVSFTVTASQPGCAADSDTMVLTIQKNPIANAGTSLQICEGESVTIPGSGTNPLAVFKLNQLDYEVVEQEAFTNDHTSP